VRGKNSGKNSIRRSEKRPKLSLSVSHSLRHSGAATGSIKRYSSVRLRVVGKYLEEITNWLNTQTDDPNIRRIRRWTAEEKATLVSAHNRLGGN
jgi:hypothetical protein